MNRLGSLYWLASAALLPACINVHGLGEIETSTGDDSGSSTGSMTSNGDSASSAGLPPVSTSDASSTSPSSDGSTTASDDTEGTETGEPVDCEPARDFVRWDGPVSEPLPGLAANSVAILSGACVLGVKNSADASPDIPFYPDLPLIGWTLALDCTMSGRIDGDPNVIDLPVSTALTGNTTMNPANWMPFVGGPLELRVFLVHWGMGWDRHVVLWREDTVLYDLIDGSYLDPADADSWQPELQAITGGQPWHGGLQFTPFATECPLSVSCNGEHQGLSIDWGGGPSVEAQPLQTVYVETAVPRWDYGVSVDSAVDYSRGNCRDTPLGDYRIAIWSNNPLE